MIARYVSVDVLDGTYLTLCEVLVEEYPIEDCLHNITSNDLRKTVFVLFFGCVPFVFKNI